MGRSATSGSAAACLLAAAAALGGCSTASYGTGESPEMAIFREMTGGMLSEKKEPVTYQPRAPLVLPPSANDLPPPAAPVEVANAQWPDDPDQGGSGERVFNEETRDEVSQDEYRRLKPLAGLSGGKPASRPGEKRNGDTFQPAYDMVNQKQQREAFNAAVNEATGISAERRYLTDPPDTVREPAATAPQEFEEIEKKKDGNFLTRIFTGG